MTGRKGITLALAAVAGCGSDVANTGAAAALGHEDPGMLGDDVVVGAADDPAALSLGAAARADGAPQVIYANFSDGTTKLTKGAENAMMNQSSICGVDAFPAWRGTEERKQEIQNQLQEMLNDFNVILTAKRPTSSPYSMIMVGPGAEACRFLAGGVAPMDCDNRNPANICFDFSATGSAITMAQEIGHTFGLAHTDVACDVMGASYSRKPCVSGKWGFTDTTGALLGGARCGRSIQNSYQAMKEILGVWPGGVHPDPTGDGMLCADAAPPTIRISEPADGATVLPDFVVRAEATDDCGKVVEAAVALPSQGLRSVTTASPFAWELANITLGSMVEVVVTAIDAQGKEGRTSIVVHVKADVPPQAGGCQVASDRPVGSMKMFAAVLAGVLIARRRHRSAR